MEESPQIIMHILMNVTAMLSLGLVVERSAHRHLLAPVWFAGAVAGSVLSWAMLPATSVGASGGIMAVFSFLIVMAWRRRALLPPDFLHSLLRSLMAMALLGVLAWAVIDNAAHLGGLLAGGIAGAWVFRNPEGSLPLQDNDTLRLIGGATDVAFVALAAFTIMKLVV